MTARRFFIVGTATLTLISMVALVGVFLTNAADSEPSEALASVDALEERGVIEVPEHDLFLVWNGGEPLALSADAQHVGDQVVYCESSEMFESPAHGEKFDSRGFYYGGPAPRGLARYPVTIIGDGIYVRLDEPIEGPERGEGPAHDPRGPFCVSS